MSNIKSIFEYQIIRDMSKIMINPELLIDNDMFQFKAVDSMYKGFTDVYFSGYRVAIINGISSALQWTNDGNIDVPIHVIDSLELLCAKLVHETYLENK